MEGGVGIKHSDKRVEEYAYEKGYRATKRGEIIGTSGKTLKLQTHASGELYFGVRAPKELGRKMWHCKVHRFIGYIKFGGRIYEDDILVRHPNNDMEDNRWENIELGTRSVKQHDFSPEERHNFAANAGRSKSNMTMEKARKMRELHKQGIPYSKLMKKFGISKTSVSDIVNNRVWQ